MKTQTKPKETQAIQMMPVGQLRQHPQNPRKDLGDLSELTDSIRENGILQNLTITPYVGEVTGEVLEDTFKVIIGHRRLAAAKLAGLTHVPCAVVEMTPAEQVKTMLMENMQRTDLTPLEQADGFQMVLDMGMTFEEVARDSGFSQSTIRRRLKLRDLDRQTLEDRLTQGATLMDLVKLEQLEDEKDRNAVLKSAGTNNFGYELRRALDKQKHRQNRPLWLEILESFAQKIPKDETNKWQYINWHSLSEDPAEFKKPEDADTETYGYSMESGSFVLRKLRDDAAEIEDAAADRTEYELRVKEIEATLNAGALAAYELRLAFVKAWPLRKKHFPEAIAYLLAMLGDEHRPHDISLSAILDVPTGQGWSKDRGARKDAYEALLKESPEKALMAMIYALTGDNSSARYHQTYFNSHCFPRYAGSSGLDHFYDFLELLGYPISDEELLLMNGEHPAYKPGAEEAELESSDEDEDEEADDE